MSTKRIHQVGIVMNGVTGRMGLNQHLRRSLMAIRAEGGVRLSDNETIMPEVMLVGRNAEKLEAIAKEQDGLKWSTDVDGCARKTRHIRFILTHRPPTAAWKP